MNSLDEYYVSILGFISSSKSSFKPEENIFQEFIGTRLSKTDVKNLLRALVQLQYIKPVDKDPQRIQVLDSDFTDVTPEQKVKGYKITELGRHKIGVGRAGSSISVGNNVNFALNSPGVKQSIDVTEFKEDVQIKIGEMQEAVRSNDRSRFLKCLGYILDKGVDISIALALAYAGVPK